MTKIDTYKKLLISYCKYKSNLLYKFTGIEYYDKKDFEELDSWSEAICKRILANVLLCLRKGSVENGANDIDLCPWCTYKNIKRLKCVDCGYAKRHGNCKYRDTAYNKMTKTIGYLMEGGDISELREVDFFQQWDNYAIIGYSKTVGKLTKMAT